MKFRANATPTAHWLHFVRILTWLARGREKGGVPKDVGAVDVWNVSEFFTGLHRQLGCGIKENS